MKIIQISSSQSQPKSRKVSLAEKLPKLMGKITPGGSLHPLAEDLYSVVLLLYKGQEEKQTCSEKAMLKACSDLLNNGIAEWQSKDNFKHFSDLDVEIIRSAIWRLLDIIETQEELKSHLLNTHLKRAVREVCGGMSYTQAIGTALACIEAGLTNHSGIPQIVWNAAMKFSPAERSHTLAPTPVKEDSHEISGLQLRGHGAPRQGEPERRNDRRAVQANTAFPRK